MPVKSTILRGWCLDWHNRCARFNKLAVRQSSVHSSQLFICDSPPVETAAPCGFVVCHPHGVVCAEMAGGSVSHPS